MIINFVGNYQNGYVGEISDENHLAREIENLGHTVRRIPRDVWREWVLGNYKERPKEIPEDLKSDINIIAKWHHFFDGKFISELKKQSDAPVFYWVWDFMDDQGIPDWHVSMAKEANLYLSGELGIFDKYKALGIKPYYFQFDVCDGDINRVPNNSTPKKNDVIFTGSYLKQGNRIPFLKEINKEVSVKIYSWNYEEWIKEGFEAYSAVYGEEYNKLITQSKITLGFSVEANCWGYWSNRVGKVLRAGGFLLQEYAPGMESLIGDKAEYFSSPSEAVSKIKFYLDNDFAREMFAWRVFDDEFTSKKKVKELVILCERFLKGDPKIWKI